ncbi:MAG TPA: hypothetical protein VNG12_04985 [Acidimicrobiales bacterium]|nr:hypothetical protein [Acidimicrobiales bacterium]
MFRKRIEFGTLDRSRPYQQVFEITVSCAILVADLLQVAKVRHEAPCIRRRVRDPSPCRHGIPAKLRATSATVCFWSMTSAAASVRDSFGHRPRCWADFGCSSVATA